VTEARVRILLIGTILVMSTLPFLGAFYFLDSAVETSLNLGFNPRIEQGLDIGTESLKTLRKLDPQHQEEYRSKFETLVDLKRIYSEPDWLKSNILRPLRIYFGLGLAALVLIAVAIAALLSRRITNAYGAMLGELLAERERVRYLRQMESWQELARVLAHEIKNPLTPVEVLMSSLGRAYAEKSPAVFQKQLADTERVVSEELAHLKRTVARFSEFSRLSRPELSPQNPSTVVRQHLSALQASFPTARVQLDTRELSETTRASMDASLFRHVLMNIVSNGVEANEGRQITFDIQLSRRGSEVQIRILNDGAPVPPTLAEQLFEPYVSERRSKENMGLGLAIVKKIIVEHGGSIHYIEREGHPQFVIALPCPHPE
jgi:signal transduction histidine kinase